MIDAQLAGNQDCVAAAQANIGVINSATAAGQMLALASLPLVLISHFIVGYRARRFSIALCVLCVVWFIAPRRKVLPFFSWNECGMIWQLFALALAGYLFARRRYFFPAAGMLDNAP
jgi:hypothetical protein